MLRTTLVSALRRLSTWLMMSLLCFELVAWSPARAATPTLLATGFSNITAIASDGTYIYFGTINGQLYRMTKTGTDLRNIANVSGFIGDIEFNNGRIWFYGNPTAFDGASIYTMPQDLSAGPTVFLSNVVKLMGINGSTVYYWAGASGIKSIPIGGGSPPIGNGTPDVLLPGAFPLQFAVDGSSIFLNSVGGDGIVRLDTLTKTLSTVIAQAPAPANVFVDANNVYSSNRCINTNNVCTGIGIPTIVQAPKQGGVTIPLVTLAGGGDALLSDGNSVYYQEGPGGVALTNTLKSIPVGGGTPTTLAEGVSIRFMININGTLYWCTPATSGAAIYRLDGTSLPPVPVSVVPLDKSATVMFSPAPGSSTPTKYRIVVTNGAQQTVSVHPADELGNLSMVLNDLTNGFLYGLSAFATNISGAESPQSTPVSVRPRSEPLSVQEAGTNSPPLVFLHGFMSDITTWYLTSKKLGSKYKTKTFAIPFSKIETFNACEQMTELNLFMNNIVLPATNNAKVIFIGHSQGGIVARGYLQFGSNTQAFGTKMQNAPHNGPNDTCAGMFAEVPKYFVDGNAPVAGLITYGTPHNGADIESKWADAVTLLRPGSPFMNTINNFTATGFPLPENLPIVSIVGKKFSFSSDDCFIPSASQDLTNARTQDLPNARFSSETHLAQPEKGVIHASELRSLCPFSIFNKPETQDHPAIEKALGWIIMKIELGSPADVVVRSPSGQVVSKTQREIWGTDYRQLEDVPGHVSTVVSIPFPEPGSYAISVVPHADALPSDTFTLSVEVNGKRTVLANQMRIAEAPTAPFTVKGPPPNQHPIANAGRKQKVKLDSVIQLDGSASRDPDNSPSSLRYSWEQVSGPSVLLLNSATVKPKFTPVTRGHYQFSLVVNDGQSNSNISTVKVNASKNGDLDEEVERDCVLCNPFSR